MLFSIVKKMDIKEALSWLKEGRQRQELFNAIRQPVTADQLSRHKGVSLDSASSALRELSKSGLLYCLNPESRTSRLYWFTVLGQKCQRSLLQKDGQPKPDYDLPDVDWKLYGWTCYRHRSAVLKVLKVPLQPATIKRIAFRQDPDLRMSANNVRDIIRLFEKKGIVSRILVRKKKHPLYTLTELGEKLRILHLSVDSF